MPDQPSVNAGRHASPAKYYDAQFSTSMGVPGFTHLAMCRQNAIDRVSLTPSESSDGLSRSILKTAR
jgi:hypothetical protein